MPDGEALEDLNLPVVVAEGGHGKEGDSSVASGDTPGELRGGAELSKKARDKKSTQSGESVMKCEPKAFILSEGLPPVPAKLVGRILRGTLLTCLSSCVITWRQSGVGFSLTLLTQRLPHQDAHRGRCPIC